jgi:hypothetical protein
MQPRQELLDIWRAVLRTSWRRDEQRWHWGGRYAPNSIADAEQLLCLLLPASQVDVFGVDEPDRTGEDILDALQALGGATEIPRRLIGIFTEYFERYTDPETGTPIFSGGSYFDAEGSGIDPTEEQRSLDIVDSFAMAVTVGLASIGFVRVYRNTTRRVDVREQLSRLEDLASIRLTAAMVGLLRSFAVNVFDTNSSFGRNLLHMVNQNRLPTRHVVTDLQQQLRQTTASFREVLIGSGQVSDLDSPDRLFECGWSWGIVRDAPMIETTEKIGEQRDGVATQLPYLYFTVIAMDALEELFSERTRILGLLNEEQQRLARALQLRWDLTRSYWATVATFGAGPQWPIEDIPWRTSDGEESEYFTLQVTSLAVKGLTLRRGSDSDLVRIGTVLYELANRGRITRRPLTKEKDPGLALHEPGVQQTLVGSEATEPDAPRLTWLVREYAPLLLQRLTLIAGLLNDARQRGTLLELADRVWDHLVERRLTIGSARELWDEPGGAFPELGVTGDERPTWYYTERVVQALVVTANVLDRPPLRSERVSAIAFELLSEAEHLFDRELMRGSAAGGPVLEETIKQIRATLRRTREVLPDRPGTAAVLASNVLELLDELSAGRQNASEVI